MKKLFFKLALKYIKNDNAVQYGNIFNDTFIPESEIEATKRVLSILSKTQVELFTPEDLKIENRYNCNKG